MVIALASYHHLRSLGLLQRAAAACDIVLDNHAPAGDGLVRRRGQHPVAATFTTANSALAWTWSAELFAASTRRGKTLAILPKISPFRRKNEIFERNWSTRFHHKTIAQIAPGLLGQAYLKKLRSLLGNVSTASWPALVATIDRAAATIMDGGDVYLRTDGQSPPYHVGGKLIADANLFRILDHDGSDTSLPLPRANDFVIAIGYDAPPSTDWWGQPHLLHGAGLGVSWIITSYLTNANDFQDRNILVDQHWAEGDALVRANGYDVRLALASGVIQEAIYWAVTAGVYDQVQRHRTMRRPRISQHP